MRIFRLCFGYEKLDRIFEIDATIEPVVLSQIPQDIEKYFSQRSAMFLEKEFLHETRKMLGYYAIRHLEPQYTTYIARSVCKYPNGTEDVVYLYDSSTMGEKIGCSEIRNIRTQVVDGEIVVRAIRPFVAQTTTIEEFQNHGFAKQCLLDMQSLSKKFFGVSLHSDSTILSPADQVRENFVNAGMAQKYTYKGKGRYKFSSI